MKTILAACLVAAMSWPGFQEASIDYPSIWESATPFPAFLDGVNAASLALMAVVTWQLGSSAVRDVPTAVLALASAVLLLRYRVNSSWLILGGGALGIAAHFLGLAS